MKPILVLSAQDNYSSALERALQEFRDSVQIVPLGDFFKYASDKEFAERTSLIILDPSEGDAVWEVVKALKTEYTTRPIPVIAATKAKSERDRFKALTLDIEEYFSFPFSKNEFAHCCARAIEMYHEASNYRNAMLLLKNYREMAKRSAIERKEMEGILNVQEAVIEMNRKELQEVDGIRSAQEAVFEMSRMELLEAHDKLRQSYDSKLAAMKEKSELQMMFGKYIAPEVIEVLMSEDGLQRLAGVKQDVSILFADIRGFTRICENKAPNEVLVLLDEFFAGLSETIIAHNGIIDKYEGDNIMAIFGAPVPRPDHVESAILAAINMQRRFLPIKERWKAECQIEAGLGIGVNCGTAIVGNVGCYHKISYTAIGDVVNTAARFEQNARDGQVIFGDDLRARLADKFLQINKLQIQNLEPIDLRGKKSKHMVYTIGPSNS
jgi:class 3 adenylate cyclase/DNA-binding response OmpR family regulator